MYHRDMLKYKAIDQLILLNKYQIMFQGTIYDQFIVPNFMQGIQKDDDDDDDELKSLF